MGELERDYIKKFKDLFDKEVKGKKHSVFKIASLMAI